MAGAAREHAMTNEELVALGKRSLLGNYKQPPFVLVRGEGSRVEDADGRRYLDLAAGIAVCALGHAHPALADAVAAQARRLVHTSNLFYNEPSVRLADALTRRTGFDKVFFCNSGTEANEAMLKLARRWHYERGDRERVELVATHNSFHGRTMGALSVTGQPKYHQGMEPLVGGVQFVAYGDLDAMRAVVGPRTAAVIVEPIQAEGGIFVGTDAYLAGLRAICDEAGALLLFDEIQTGYGRTGAFLCREHAGVWPDATSLAKGIAGGFPLGAMLVSAKVANGLPPGTHGTTFGGNPVACAAGLALLEVFEAEGVVARAGSVGAYLGERLAALAADVTLPAACEARGRGLLRGLRVSPGYDPLAILAQIRAGGVLLSIAGGDVLRFSPSLLVTREELDEGLAVVERVLRAAVPLPPAGSPA
jgi:predicted acetylornithine/succinylornithine family transaminase